MSLSPKRLKVKKKKEPAAKVTSLEELRRRMGMRDVQEAMASRDVRFEQLVSPTTVSLEVGADNQAMR